MPKTRKPKSPIAESPAHSEPALTQPELIPADPPAVPSGEAPAELAGGDIMNVREILAFLTAIKRTPAGQVPADSELAERFEKSERGVTKVWMPDKRACVELFLKLQGMLVDRTKTEHSGQVEHTFTIPESLRIQLLERHRQALLMENAEGPDRNSEIECQDRSAEIK